MFTLLHLPFYLTLHSTIICISLSLFFSSSFIFPSLSTSLTLFLSLTLSLILTPILLSFSSYSFLYCYLNNISPSKFSIFSLSFYIFNIFLHFLRIAKLNLVFIFISMCVMTVSVISEMSDAVHYFLEPCHTEPTMWGSEGKENSFFCNLIYFIL